MKNFPNGVLSFIGQRKYESEARHDKPRIWNNPWTPGQTGASPIQNWNSLHVWLYIFLKEEPFNVWYTRGLDRIGCFLCPASDMSELEIVAGNSDRYDQWNKFLDDYMKSRGLPQEWKDYALWRWKKAPQSIREEVNKITGKEISELTKQTITPEKGPLFLKVQEGYSPCIIGYSIEGALSRPIDLIRLEKFAHILRFMEIRRHHQIGVHPFLRHQFPQPSQTLLYYIHNCSILSSLNLVPAARLPVPNHPPQAPAPPESLSLPPNRLSTPHPRSSHPRSPHRSLHYTWAAPSWQTTSAPR